MSNCLKALNVRLLEAQQTEAVLELLAHPGLPCKEARPTAAIDALQQLCLAFRLLAKDQLRKKVIMHDMVDSTFGQLPENG